MFFRVKSYASVYLKCHTRFKDGKEHRYWSIVESRRCAGDRVVQRHVLYLGEINDSQQEAWLRCIQVFDSESQKQVRLALFPADRSVPEHASDCGVQVCLGQFTIHRPRQWGACWLFVQLWKELHLDQFWRPRLLDSREGTSWYHVLVTLCAYRLIDPGSEWRLHREWFERSAMADLLEEDFALAEKDNLYRVQDKLLLHKEELFIFLRQRWQDLFGVKFDLLLYDLTSTYFESDPPFAEGDKRQFGYSRDKRPDCVQVVIALVLTPEGFPLAYEVMAGNTSDRTTLRGFLEKIEQRYGKAERTWLMDRGIPTEATLEQMRAREVAYLVGTPKGQLSKLESALAERSWEQARQSVRVKLLPNEQELYVYVESQQRVTKERQMRRRKLKKLWNRLKELQKQRPSYKQLLLALGAAKSQAGRVWSLVKIKLPAPPAKDAPSQRVDFTFALDKKRLRRVRRREGRYLLRSNLTSADPGQLWEKYLLLTQIELAFKNMKTDLALRPIYHQKEKRIEAHIFISFLAYCLHISLRQKIRNKAPGLTSASVLEKFAAIQMLDVHFPTTDGRELIFSRYTQPEVDQKLLLAQLGLELPEQSPPRITAKKEVQM